MTPSEIIALTRGKQQYSSLVYRFVETQAEAGTDYLVDDLEELAVLESIIDDFKPPAVTADSKYHYLITTPFRYPPLKHGSRFGTRAQNSYYYASEDMQTCLAEAAFYRFAFFDGMSEPFAHKVRSIHQLFTVATMTPHALDLTDITDKSVSDFLRSATDYHLCQKVGASARQNGYTLIRYNSARSEPGINVAIDNIAVITSTTPVNITAVKCETFAVEGVIRMSLPKSFPVTFRRERFLINGAFPYPAA